MLSNKITKSAVVQRPWNAVRAAALLGILTTGGSTVAVAQSFLNGAAQERVETIQSPPSATRAGNSRILNSTGFFVDGAGHVLTVRHAVEGCTQVMVAKEKYRINARVIALSSRHDLALLKIPKTLGLAAVFPNSTRASANDMVFADAYAKLSVGGDRGALLANARVASANGSDDIGQLVMESPITFGASGAPVLDRNGLVQGVVSQRTKTNKVAAVGVSEAKAFLSANGVRVEQDDRPQLAGSTSRASRAASVSANVICLQN